MNRRFAAAIQDYFLEQVARIGNDSRIVGQGLRNGPLDFRVLGSRDRHFSLDLVIKVAVKQQMGLHDDLTVASAGDFRQFICQQRAGHGEEGDLDFRKWQALLPQSGEFVHFGAGGLVVAAATDEKDARIDVGALWVGRREFPRTDSLVPPYRRDGLLHAAAR
jgi:hypothetical protein